MEVKTEVENNIDILACEICFKSFKRNEGLKKHRRVHEQVERIPCKLCDKTYSSTSSLKTHQVTHSGEKTHQLRQMSLNIFQVAWLEKARGNPHSREAI